MNREDALSALWWATTAVLAGFLCLTQLAAMISVALCRSALPSVAPVSLAGAIVLADILGRRAGWSRRVRWHAAGLALAIVAAAAGVAGWYFDLTFDGQWYHQTAILAIARDWNPLAEPMREFPSDLILWVRHYAKGPWYFAAAVYRTTGEIELGKCFDGIAWASMFLAAFAASLDWGLTRARSAAVALVVALNPVVTSVLTGYLIETVLGSFLIVTIAAICSALRRPSAITVAVAIAAAIITLNAKLTGLVYISVVFAAGAFWCGWKVRHHLRAYLGLATLAGLLGAGVWGYNPYLTNTLERHHPFYPVLGTRAYPSLTAQGREGIERYETPKNLLEKNRFGRLGYALFGRPGNAPYAGQRDAELMWPFAVRWADLKYYHYHETRVAGFGPFFSGALALSLALTLWIACRREAPRAAFLLALAAVCGTTVLSPHMWWARYSPQIWLLGVLPAIAALHPRSPVRLQRAGWLLVGLLVANGAIVAGIRLRWETHASRELRQQLATLRDARQPIEVNPRWFRASQEERLSAWGIPHVLKGRRDVQDGVELKSVVEGYPGAVRYRVIHDGSTASVRHGAENGGAAAP